MAITSVNETEFRKVISKNLTPSEEIRTPERLFGRVKNLTSIDRALNSPGRQIFIYGDRGVGKTSLAVTAAHVHNTSASPPIYVPCGRTSTFSGVIQAIGKNMQPASSRMEKAASGRGLNINVPIVGGFGIAAGTPASTTIAPPTTVDEALDVIKYVAERRSGRLIVVIDEMERIEATKERDNFAEFIKNISTLENDVRFIFCGIGSDINKLLNAHPSAGRILETISLEKLRHSDLWSIILAANRELGIEIDTDMLVRISQISDGFPHFVHLIGDTMLWDVFDDTENVKRIGRAHFKVGIKGALERTEAILRSQYKKAVQKTKNTEDYEETLWAMADNSSYRRQLSEIYESSYVRIMRRRGGRKTLPKEIFNQRLLSLRRDGHGRAIVGHGAGWFSFREKYPSRLRPASSGNGRC